MKAVVFVLCLPLIGCAAGASDRFASAGKATGIASYYGAESGRRTASGEWFRPEGLSAAHRTLPFGTRLSVTNLATSQTCIVRVNDRGPALWTGRVLDLSTGAARLCGLIKSGTARIAYSILGD